MFKVHLLEKNATCPALNALMFTATRLAHVDERQHRITEKLPANDSDRSTSVAGTLPIGGLE